MFKKAKSLFVQILGLIAQDENPTSGIAGNMDIIVSARRVKQLDATSNLLSEFNLVREAKGLNETVKVAIDNDIVAESYDFIGGDTVADGNTPTGLVTLILDDTIVATKKMEKSLNLSKLVKTDAFQQSMVKALNKKVLNKLIAEAMGVAGAETYTGGITEEVFALAQEHITTEGLGEDDGLFCIVDSTVKRKLSLLPEFKDKNVTSVATNGSTDTYWREFYDFRIYKYNSKDATGIVNADLAIFLGRDAVLGAVSEQVKGHVEAVQGTSGLMVVLTSSQYVGTKVGIENQIFMCPGTAI